jgi:hypothetical protein
MHRVKVYRTYITLNSIHNLGLFILGTGLQFEGTERLRVEIYRLRYKDIKREIEIARRDTQTKIQRYTKREWDREKRYTLEKD